MRDIVLIKDDKVRPALVLTRDTAAALRDQITIAPITSTIRGLVSEVPVGQQNGLDHDCVVLVDNIATIPKAKVLRVIGFLLPEQEPQLARAISDAFDLFI